MQTFRRNTRIASLRQGLICSLVLVVIATTLLSSTLTALANTAPVPGPGTSQKCIGGCNTDHPKYGPVRHFSRPNQKPPHWKCKTIHTNAGPVKHCVNTNA
ncbi:MAG TPA: hypothetical protein VGL94_19475 [Ktedonobacteraceae bacterium]